MHREFSLTPHTRVGRDNSVGVATRYGLDGPGIESRVVGRDFPHPSRPVLDPPSLLYNGHRVFPGGNVAGVWRWPPTLPIAEVKERVELYFSTSGPSWPVLRVNFTYNKVDKAKIKKETGTAMKAAYQENLAFRVLFDSYRAHSLFLERQPPSGQGSSHSRGF